MPPPSTAYLDSCRVLAVSSTAGVEGLFQNLLHLTNHHIPQLNEGESSPCLSLALFQFSYEAVTLVAREQRDPFALVIVEIPQGVENMAAQIAGALYHADAHLHMILLTAGNATVSKTLADTVNQSNRLAILRMPCDAKELFHLAQVMATKWLRERQIETLKREFHELHASTRRSHDSGPLRADQATGGAARKTGDHAKNEEAIAGLASGIAHEFNNVLTVIQSQTDMALRQVANLPTVVDLLNQVMECTRSASNLSRRLVALAPKERGNPMAVQLTNLVDEEVALLRKTLGEHISLQVDHGAGLPLVWTDPATVGQVIINVAVHAREAMPGGGTLLFSTRRVEVETGGKQARAFPSARHGSYVLLNIEDPNPNSQDETLPPDATTAVPGVADLAPTDRLAWIRETMEVCGGAFNVTLIPGMIRTYQLLFPLAPEHANLEAVNTLPPFGSSNPNAAFEPEVEPGKIVPSTILVVDDDETICMVITQVLGMENHRVLLANNADEGWRQWRQNSSSIRLIITDINMPGGANGIALGQAIQEEDRTVPVIYTSGYRATHQFAELLVGSNYLPKPFGMSDLLKVVNRNLAMQSGKTWAPLTTARA